MHSFEPFDRFPRTRSRGSARRRPRALSIASIALCPLLGAICAAPAADEAGVSETAVRIGGVMDLEGLSRGLGRGMRTGIEAAFDGVEVLGRSLEFVAMNDYYDPPTAAQATRQLVAEGIFAMVGNVGTPTAAASLPVLVDAGVPAVGFFTGADLLRPGRGDIVNFRASYVQETASIIDAAIESGVAPGEICAYVQNDAYGMAGVSGIKLALGKRAGMGGVTDKLDQILAMDGTNPPRNDIGPVGLYTRNTVRSREGYDSLKNWERQAGTRCRLVVTVGAYPAIANFTGFAASKGEKWVVSAVSFTGADNLKNALQPFRVDSGVAVTQVVPPLDSDLPIVAEAREALGAALGYVSLEGYIVGRMFVAALQSIEGEITRDAFLAAVRGRSLDLGGLTLDFTDDNQGSDAVVITYLEGGGFRTVSGPELARIFN